MLARLSGDIIIALKMERWIWLFIVAGWIFFFLSSASIVHDFGVLISEGRWLV